MTADLAYEILLSINVGLALSGFVINLFAYRRFKERGRWIFLVLSLNCLLFLATHAQLLADADLSQFQLRGVVTLALSSYIAAPIILAFGRGRCP